MRPIQQKVYGQIISLDDKVSVWMHAKPTEAEKVSAETVYLRYALTIKGSEKHIFPAFVLDDWGNELRRVAFYKWIKENGEWFPRGEIFGFDANGQESQFFVREIELYFKYACYVVADRNAPITDGQLVERIIFTGLDSAEFAPIKCPDHIKSPLRHSSVEWWAASPQYLRKING